MIFHSLIAVLKFKFYFKCHLHFPLDFRDYIFFSFVILLAFLPLVFLFSCYRICRHSIC